jgi:hypothetical protein
MMATHAQFITECIALIGTPVVHMGRLPGLALDCVGVPWCAARACGIPLPETLSYDAWPDEETLTAELSRYCTPAGEGETPHILQVLHGKHARHVVVPIGGGNVVQARPKSALVEVSPFVGLVRQAWRVRGIE